MVGDFFAVMGELSVDEIHDEALLPPSLLVVGQRQQREASIRALLGGAVLAYTVFADEVPPTEGARYDLVALVATQESREELQQAISRAESQGWPVVVLLTPEARADLDQDLDTFSVRLSPDSSEALGTARDRLVAVLDENRLPSWGRHLPELRSMIATSLVQTTARTNAQFAVISNVPAIIPLIGNIVGATADFFVLTKNQLLLVYKLAAVFGRDIDDRKQLLIEMAPVVGSGLVWRTVARELVALVPGLISAVPKVMIAYTGTFVVGRAALFYYEQGRRPTRADWDEFYRQALTTMRSLWSRLRPAGREHRSRDVPATAVPPTDGRVEERVGQTVH
jgi:uncharacterized protein (DUF697 family)